MSRRARKKSCNKYRHQQELKKGAPHLRLVQPDYTDYNQVSSKPRQKHVHISPKNTNQVALMQALEDPKIDIVLAVGPAGTGKTLLSTLVGVRDFKAGDFGKMVITRPVVSADEELGALPGTIRDKLGPWVRPMLDVLDDYFTPQHVEYMIEDNQIELSPLGMMRGRTFKNSWIIADEMQSATVDQFKMILTRIGTGSKLVITGDPGQCDLKGKPSGLLDFVRRIEQMGKSARIAVVYFDRNDVERHPVVGEVLDLYNQE
jgi:phosphate starvation-inducible protein PhoH and related proteins